jgi:PAS domain-containing protein
MRSRPRQPEARTLISRAAALRDARSDTACKIMAATREAMKTERRSGTDRRRPARSDRDGVRAIVERMADGVVVVSDDGLIRFANPAAERLFGRPAAALCGQPFGLPMVGDESTEVELHRPGGDAVTAELRLVESD